MKLASTGITFDAPIFLEYPSTKTDLAVLIEVSRTTLVSWDNIAYWNIDDYRQDYPLINQSERDRQCPLTPYQAWCVARVGKVMSIFRKKDRVERYIASHKNEFSKYEYRKQAQKVYPIGA
jgi:hypothetical protein